MNRPYSRRAIIEERKNLKKAFIFIVLSIVTILILIFFGIPLTAKFVSFISDLTKKDIPITLNDNTPPAPPRLNNVPDYTNKSVIEISGNAEEGAMVTVFINSSENEVIADSYGEFRLSSEIKLDENIIYAISRDQSGNTSVESQRFIVVLDKEAPEINIDSPSDESKYYGSEQREIEISGKTDPETTLTVNERLITLNDEGNFKYKYLLNDGENILTFKAKDMAQNESEKTLTLTFTP